MTTLASQITSLTVVYSIVYSGVDQRKHQSSASLAFVRGIHRDRWIPRTKGQWRGKCFYLMTSSCLWVFSKGIPHWSLTLMLENAYRYMTPFELIVMHGVSERRRPSSGRVNRACSLVTSVGLHGMGKTAHFDEVGRYNSRFKHLHQTGCARTISSAKCRPFCPWTNEFRYIEHFLYNLNL